MGRNAHRRVKWEQSGSGPITFDSFESLVSSIGEGRVMLPREAAARLGITRQAIYIAARKGQLHAWRVGNDQLYVDKQSVEKRLKKIAEV